MTTSDRASDRALFIAAYSRLVAEVWAEPEREASLMADPRALLSEYGLVLPDGVRVEVVRESGHAPDIQAQVQAWQDAPHTGVLALFVPPLDAIDEAPLDEDELDNVVAGLDTTCACCCPCCCT
jgi:hypothetical protein